jgi:GNAT superfamily N-acetyltransferase
MSVSRTGRATGRRLTVRRARAGDVGQLVRLWRAFHTSHYRYDRDYYRLKPMRQAMAATREHYAVRVADRDAIFLVAAEGDRLVGVLLGKLSARPPVMPPTRTFSLNATFVDPRLRGRGIFSKLFARLRRTLLRRRDVKHIELVVDVQNPVVAAYEHLGFRKLHYKMVQVLRRPRAGR